MPDTAQTKSPTIIEPGALNRLRSSISGGIALPTDESYAKACHLWNAAVVRRPAVVAFCQFTADVQAAVRFAREHDLPLSVRGGGHNLAGLALLHDGLVLDLTRMCDVAVDPHLRIATISGGAKITDVAAAADAHDLLAVAGSCGAVGMAGLTLGGGYGVLIAKHGLASDNLLGAEVVLADGQCVTVDANRHPDLLWALRGGGGNFGVVTSLKVRLHEKRHLLAGSLIYPWTQAVQVLNGFASFAAKAPDEFGLYIGMLSGPDGQPVLQLAPLWNGEQQPGERVMQDLQALGTPITAHIAPMTASEVLAPGDEQLKQLDGWHFELLTRWLPALTPEIIDQLVAAAGAKTSPFSMLLIHPFNGEATRIPPDATAFGVRDEHFLLEIIACWPPDESDGSAHRQWARKLSQNLAPLSLPGGYANLLRSEDREQASHAYGPNAGRLVALKRRFDPDNIFSSANPLPL